MARTYAHMRREVLQRLAAADDHLPPPWAPESNLSRDQAAAVADAARHIAAARAALGRSG